ncbi:MAG: hypothetical protein IJJ29_00215 [Solobacterium sp.]|nr:hypothetical protein [Solobacterium sp.]
MTAIYQKIKDAVQQDGTLPEGFSVHPVNSEEYMMGDGGFDGFSLYYGMGEVPDPGPYLQVIDDVSAGSFAEAVKSLEELLNDEYERTIYIIDPVQAYIGEHIDELDTGSLYVFATTLITQSEIPECVKFGLGVYELLDREDRQMREVICTLALADEFTLYCMYIMSHWQDGSDAIFGVAKKVTGWGKIHAVHFLEPDTEEKKDWLYRFGSSNEINDKHTALDCAFKLNIEEAVHGELSEVQFAGITGILSALLQNQALDELTDTDAFLHAYVVQARTHAHTEDDYMVLIALQNHIFTFGGDVKTADLCDLILREPETLANTQQLLKEHRGYVIAAYLGMDVCEQLLEDMRADFRDYWHYLGILPDDQKVMEKAVDIFRENLDLESLDTGPSDWPGFTADSRILQFLLYKLDAVPGVGEDLVGIGLHCFDRNVREAALDVVEAWQLRGYAHDQELEDRYLELQEKETDPGLRDRLTQKKKLLN